MDDFLIISWLLCGAVAVYFYYQKHEAPPRLTRLILFLLGPIGIVVARTIKRQRETPTFRAPESSFRVPVSNKGIPHNVHYDPVVSSKVLATVNNGETYPVVGRNAQNTWWAVRVPTDFGTKIGWIEGTKLDVSNPKAVPNIIEKEYEEILIAHGASPSRSRSWPPYLVLVFVFVFVIGIGGQMVKLTCTRVETGQPVNCIKQASFLWFISLGEEIISDVQGATLARCTTCEGGGSRVELLTAQANFPFNSVYSSIPWDFQRMQDATNRINDFIRGAGNSNELVLTDTGFFTPQTGIWILIWCLVSIAWGKIKRAFSD